MKANKKVLFLMVAILCSTIFFSECSSEPENNGIPTPDYFITIGIENMKYTQGKDNKITLILKSLDDIPKEIKGYFTITPVLSDNITEVFSDKENAYEGTFITPVEDGVVSYSITETEENRNNPIYIRLFPYTPYPRLMDKDNRKYGEERRFNFELRKDDELIFKKTLTVQSEEYNPKKDLWTYKSKKLELDNLDYVKGKKIGNTWKSFGIDLSKK